MKTILYVAPRFPYPPDKGDKLITVERLRNLSLDHRIVFISFYQSAKEKSHLENLRRFCIDIRLVRFSFVTQFLRALLLFFFSRMPLQVLLFTSPGLRKAVDGAVQDHAVDLLHVNTVRVYENCRHLAGKIPVVCEFIDALSLNMQARSDHDFFPRSLFFRWEAERMRSYESEVRDRVDAVALVSTYDAGLIGAGKTVIAPVGIERTAVRLKSRETGMVIAFSGNMGYFPNDEAARWFADYCFPAIRERYPSAEFWVIGKCPSRAMRRYAGIPGIRVSGRVPSILEALSGAQIVVAPMQSGSGMQLKILEALSLGKPVVTTTIGNRALKTVHGVHILIADTPEECIAACVSLLADRELRRSLGVRAKQLVTREYTWEKSNLVIRDTYLKIFRQEQHAH